MIANGIEDPESRVIVPHPALTSEREVPVTISIANDAGKVLVPSVTSIVVPTRQQPNGPGCDPVFYSAVVTVSPTP
ncbi:MAG: hypothetical protein ABIP45_12240 [Knoellia sp.]